MHYKVFAKIFVGWIVSLSILALFISGTPVAFAATPPTDPLVIADVDVTNLYGPCLETFKDNIGTPQESDTHINCPSGTIRHMQIIHRSKALAQHNLYVLLPPSQASAHEKQQAWQQFLDLVKQESQAHQHLLAQTIIHPDTSCGGTGLDSLSWYINGVGDQFYSTISFYKTTDCQAISFDTATLTEETHNPNKAGDWYWSFDKYAGATYNVPNCPDMTAVTHASHGIGETNVPNETYENWIGNWTACQPWLLPSYWWNDIGPIN